jgi:hypothetical protein
MQLSLRILWWAIPATFIYLYDTNFCFSQVRYLSNDELCRGAMVYGNTTPAVTDLEYEEYKIGHRCDISKYGRTYVVDFIIIGEIKRYLPVSGNVEVNVCGSRLSVKQR